MQRENYRKLQEGVGNTIKEDEHHRNTTEKERKGNVGTHENIGNPQEIIGEHRNMVTPSGSNSGTMGLRVERNESIGNL